MTVLKKCTEESRSMSGTDIVLIILHKVDVGMGEISIVRNMMTTDKKG